jgi:hypothetical protein
MSHLLQLVTRLIIAAFASLVRAHADAPDGMTATAYVLA